MHLFPALTTAHSKPRTVKLDNGVELKAVGLKGPNQFAVDSAKNQTRNALGIAAGFGVAILFTGGIVAGAPLILLSMGVGFAVSIAYDSLGMDDFVEAKAKKLFQ